MGYDKVKEWRSRPEAKAMRAAQARRYRAKHPDKVKAVKSAYLERSRDERLPREAEAAQRRRKADPEGQRRRNLAYLERQRTRQEQIAGRPRSKNCELCLEECRVVFDHCHQHGHFRGWICDRCNKVLGLVKDSQILLSRMRHYLEANSGEANGGFSQADTNGRIWTPCAKKVSD